MLKTVTQENVKKYLHYCPKTGEFTWRVTNSVRALAGSKAGFTNRSTGYVVIGLHGRRWYAHRLAWMYVYGECPRILDHINRNKSDNRIVNLRPASHRQNIVNANFMARGQSGVIGICQTKSGLRWRAKVGKIHVGYFSTLEEAIAAREAKRLELFGDFARVA